MMNFNKAIAIAFTVSASSLPAFADQNAVPQGDMTIIELAGHQVPVKAGGLYDRYRSHTPLSVIAKESPQIDLSWFETLDKTKVDVGFETWSPNFYYDNSRVSVIYTADIERLRELMPPKVLAVAPPISIWPGRGLVALTGYAYKYCDNDSYNEIAVSIVTSKPGSTNLGPISLASSLISKDFWGYVVKLPLDSELGRVRGVVGYNLPKWLTPIRYKETASSVIFEITVADTGEIDFVLETDRLEDLSSKVNLVTTHFTNLNEAGELRTGYAVSRQLQHASSSDAEVVNLQLSNGSLSTFLKSLNLGRMMKYEYVPSFQSALYTPSALETAANLQ